MSPLVHTRTKPSSKQTVLPDKLSPETAKLLRQTLHPIHIEKGYAWIFQNVSEEKEPLALAEMFFEHFEQRMLKEKIQLPESDLPVFRATQQALFLTRLSRHRMKFADIGFNYVFLETWLKKKLVAEIMGITVADIDRSVFLSDLTQRDFLNEKLKQLVPMTFLRTLLKA